MQINLMNHGVIEKIEVGLAFGKLIAALPQALAKACSDSCAQSLWQRRFAYERPIQPHAPN